MKEAQIIYTEWTPDNTADEEDIDDLVLQIELPRPYTEWIPQIEIDDYEDFVEKIQIDKITRIPPDDF